MAESTVTVNRAPVLTLWAAVVAERQGFDEEEALTLGKAVAGLTAQSKGRRLGIYEAKEEKGKAAKKRGLGEEFFVPLCGRKIPAKKTEDGTRAVVKDKPIDPASVQRYLDKAFGEHLAAVRKAMSKLAKSFSPDELAEEAFGLYEAFRPNIDPGVKGWGQKGSLDLEQIRALAKSA